jgi:hypothetical protein
VKHTLHYLSAPDTAFRGVHVTGVEREFIRIKGGSGSISDVSAVARGPTQEPWHATGIKWLAGGDWYVQRAKMHGFWTHGDYVQGDGFASERGVGRLTFTASGAYDCGDGGWDIKSHGAMLDHCVAERCGKSFRFWATVRAKKITSRDPRICHVHVRVSAVHTERQTIRIDELIATGDTNRPVIFVETVKGAIPPKIILGKVAAPEGAKLLRIDGPEPEIVRL